MRTARRVVSRHRLPACYRLPLVIVWAAPGGLLVGALAAGGASLPQLLDARLLLPLAILLVPAVFIWQQGVDVLADGIVARSHWPRFYAYERLERWSLSVCPPGSRILTIWERRGRKAFECHAAHLTGLPTLTAALADHLR